MSGPLRLSSRQPDFAAAFEAFAAKPRGAPDDVAATVDAIIADVRLRGFEAVVQYAERLDSASPGDISQPLSRAELRRAADACPSHVRDALGFAASRIRALHERQRPVDATFEDDLGVGLGWRWTPIDAVGLYVPGGRASYPSSLLMNAVPAKVAGVGRIALATPVRAGVLAPAVAAAALEADVDEVWGIGGAHMIAALAYGADPIRRVDKIVGPGNAYVTAAKRAVYGQVGIDALAGPSEILVIADGLNNPQWIAADLLSQAEHDPEAQSVLITDDSVFAQNVADAVEWFLDNLPTGGRARESWRNHGAIIEVSDLVAEAPSLNDRLAPEHTEIAAQAGEEIAAALRHAGAIFIGRHAPEALGDYVTGSNHVLPTAGAARFSSGLSVLDFMKRTSIQRISPRGFAALAGPAAVLAHAEGLPAHALSVEVRQKKL